MCVPQNNIYIYIYIHYIYIYTHTLYLCIYYICISPNMFLNMFSKLGFCFWNLCEPLFKFIKPGLHALWKRGICWLQMHVVFLQLFLFSNEQAHMVHMTTAAPHNSQHFQAQFQRYMSQHTCTARPASNSITFRFQQFQHFWRRFGKA